MNTAFLTPLRAKRSAIIVACLVFLGGVAAVLAADERSQQRDRAFVTLELSRVQALVDRSGTTVAQAAREISALHDSFAGFRDRIASAAAEIGLRQTELVDLITAQEGMAVQLDALRHDLSSAFADADAGLASSSARIANSHLRAKQRQNLSEQVTTLRGSVAQRRVELTAIESAAHKNSELLVDAQLALAEISGQQQFADAAAARASELEERSEARQSRARELTQKLEEAQREINAVTSGLAAP